MIRHKLPYILFSVFLMSALLIPAVAHAQGGGDMDDDGVPDKSDRCPTVPGPKDNYGCPYPDKDGDGVPDAKDACPSKPGPADNKGCPIVQQPGDRDGDGVTDNIDLCIDQPGPLSNGGCPLPEQAVTPTPPPLPVLDETGACVLATQGYDGVNIRALPQKEAAVLGVLDPYQTYPALARLTSGEEVWYRITEGWVAGWVTRLGGVCGGLADVKLGPAFGAGAFNVFFKGRAPGEVDPPEPDHMGVVSPAFCDGSVRPAFVNLGSVVQGDQPSCAFSAFGGQVGLLFLTPDGFNQPLTSPDTNQILIGLLLPAVQVAMGDGSVRTGDVNLNGILIGLTPNPGSSGNPQGILIGLLPWGPEMMGDGSVLPSPAGDNGQGILIGLLRTGGATFGDGSVLPSPTDNSGKTDGILIGLLLPAVQKGITDGTSNSHAILIGLLLPAVQTGEADPPGEKSSFDVFLPGGSAYSLNFTRTGNLVEIQVSDASISGPGGEVLSLNFTIPGAP